MSSVFVATTNQRTRLVVETPPIGSLREEWRALERRASTRSFFASWLFADTWWEHLRRERALRLYAFREPGGRLVGVAPFYVETLRTRFGPVRALRNIGFGDVVNPDFLDVLVEPEHEESVGNALHAALRADESWDFAHFSDLDPRGALPRMAERWRQSGRLRVMQEKRARCPYIPLPESFEDYLKSRNPHFRQQLRRYRRKIERDLDVTWRRVGEDVSIGAGIEQLGRLHQERMGRTGRGGNFAKDDYFVFHRHLAERAARSGELFFWLIFSQGVPIASHYGYLAHGVYYGYQMGFTHRYHKYSPGHYMTGRVMEMLIERGAHEMNLLRGTDAWKYRWAEHEYQTLQLRIVRPGVRSRLAELREALSASPPLVLRTMIGRDAFDELRAALAGFKSEGGKGPKR